MASLFHRTQADGDSEAVASLRWAQDIRRVVEAAITKPLDHVCYPGMDRDRRRRKFKVYVVGMHPGAAGRRPQSRRKPGGQPGRLGYGPSEVWAGGHPATAQGGPWREKCETHRRH